MFGSNSRNQAANTGANINDASNFQRHFAFYFYSTIACGLREDHANILQFYMSADLLRRRNQLSDIEYELLFNCGIEDPEEASIYSEHEAINKWIFLREKLKNFYQLPDCVIPNFNASKKVIALAGGNTSSSSSD